MKIDIEALDWCPDNCPYCDIQREKLYYGYETVEESKYCGNKSICLNAVKSYKKKEKKDENHTA